MYAPSRVGGTIPVFNWAENLIWPGKDRGAALPNDSV
jgi:hypothetical protein